MNHRTSLSSAIVRASLLGATAGMRSQIPLALLARNAGTYGPDLLRKRWVATNLYLSAAGEIMADKLPFVPSRLNPGPIAGRVMFGSASGAILARRLGAPVAAGIVAGAAGAVGGSFAGYHARTWLGAQTGLPDLLWAAVEDGTAILLGSTVTR